jgi:Mn2+/Fe2+ NRAMP family transporter
VAASADGTALSAWIILDAAVLLLCASMYLGTGGSLVLFQFPGRASLTVDNYYDQFVPQVQRATRFFTYMTTVMIAAAVVLIVRERSSLYVIAPSVALASVLVATGLTIKFIFPYNKEMAAGIKDPAELQRVLGKWILLNWIRVSLWIVTWVAVAAYFAWHLR